ncbi:MAG: alpha/beta hydrolase [Phycisphaerales bacterium]
MSGCVTIAALDPAATDWVGLAAVLLAGCLAAWLSGAAYARWSLRNPPRRTYGTAIARNQPGTPMELDAARFGSDARAFTEWTFERPSGEGSLPVWEIAGDNPSGPTVVFTHGWGDGRIGGLLRLAPFLATASRLLLWDLPGHGDAPARAGPCRLGRVEANDLRALLAKTDGPVVLFGWSLGAGVSIVAAADEPRVIGVVLEAPYRLPQIPASRVMGAPGCRNSAY